MPHLLAADLAATDNQDLRWMACNACWYLMARGDTRPPMTLLADLRQHWRDRLGDDHEDTLRPRTTLPGRFGTWAATPKPATWTRTPWTARRRVLGDDHPDTLNSANNLASDLTQPRRASGGPRPGPRTPWPAAAGCSARTTPTP